MSERVFTGSIEELALAHVSDVQSLEKQHQMTEIRLHDSRKTTFRHFILIHGLRVQPHAHACSGARIYYDITTLTRDHVIGVLTHTCFLT